eukprot:3602710-Prymnesium_polylepis.1
MRLKCASGSPTSTGSEGALNGVAMPSVGTARTRNSKREPTARSVAAAGRTAALNQSAANSQNRCDPESRWRYCPAAHKSPKWAASWGRGGWGRGGGAAPLQVPGNAAVGVAAVGVAGRSTALLDRGAAQLGAALVALPAALGVLARRVRPPLQLVPLGRRDGLEEE